MSARFLTTLLLTCTVAGAWPITPPALVEMDAPKLEYPAYYTTLDKARLATFTGRSRLALATLSGATNDDVEATLIRAQAWLQLGRGSRALELISTGPAKNDDRAELLRAKIHGEMGDTDAAVRVLQKLVARQPESLVARYELARALESGGDVDSARAAYAWFVDPPQGFVGRLADETDPVLESAEHLTVAARAIDRWATLSGAYQTDPSLHEKLLNAFVRAYDQVDRRYWPARVAAAEYWLSHDNTTQAIDELKAAAEINPYDGRMIELFGLIALDQFNFDGAESAAKRLRYVDSRSPRALRLEARTLLGLRQPLAAEAPLRKLLESQPKNATALGLLAAASALRLREQQSSELLAEIESIDPGNATAYYEVAQQLGAMRQYPRAIEMYKTAIARAPWWTDPRNGLGLLYTQSGDEDDARAALEAAHALDPFNLRTTNYLRLLDDLAGFAKLETEHFMILFEQQLDPIIAEPMAEYLESVHAEICREYQHEPAVKTIIEVFPTHDAFSVRTTGSPWIGTVGASTGKVIALVSPRRGQQTMGTFNWSRVLRHEYTHTVTLGATENRIPHWMTEGLAVLEERKPMPWDWVPLLYHVVKEDKLFTLEDLTWGFVRPKKPSDRQLAYAQSFWVCQYVQQKFGHDTILKMLAMYRDGKLQEEVFPATTGQSITQFETEFFAWARAQVARWGYDDASQEKYDKLRDEGEELIKSRQLTDAVKVWEEIAELRPVDALPHQRLAGLYLSKEVNQPAKAIDELRRLSDVDLHDNRYAKRLARLYRDNTQLSMAVEAAREATLVDPYDLDAQTMLRDLYQKAGNPAALERQRTRVAALEAWLAENKKRNNPQ